jgi:hypothetical protein
MDYNLIIHPAKDIWVVWSIFSSYKLNYCENLYTGLCASVLFTSVIYIPKSTIAGSYGKCLFGVLRNCHAFPEWLFTLHPHLQCMRIQFFCVLTLHLALSLHVFFGDMGAELGVLCLLGTLPLDSHLQPFGYLWDRVLINARPARTTIFLFVPPFIAGMTGPHPCAQPLRWNLGNFTPAGLILPSSWSLPHK